MKRPWQVWLAFALCALLMIAAMGWLTVHALRVDRERSVARAEAALEQRVSLALWRMDTKLAPLIAEEIARPHLFYDSFITLNTAGQKGLQSQEQVPSPLLRNTSSSVILNFEASPDGRWESPQAPPPEQAKLAEGNGVSSEELGSNRGRLAQLASAVNVQQLIDKLPAQPLPQWVDAGQDYGMAANQQGGSARGLQQQTPQPIYGNYGDANAPAQVAEAAPAEQKASPPPPAPAKGAQIAGKKVASQGDFDDRNVRVQQYAQQEYTKQRGAIYWQQNVATSAPVIENVSRPLWVGDELLLARRVVRDGQTFVQGSWLDWSRLKQDLLTETKDLVPKADLAPVHSDADADPTRMLAGLPVQLVVADTAAALNQLTAVDAPLQWALSFGWIGLGLAVAAAAALLWGVLALSERRAAFVSSVTHELRTPLTTFRMYAEMLARDMVPSPERRREYLETLKTEAERLTHLVENVLSYARLERGRRPKRTERTTAAALVERFEPRLAERATRAEMRLECTVDKDAADATLLTDVGVVEQILFNLVDNAAKYAARAVDRRIRLTAKRAGSFVHFAVCDGGPGFASPHEAARSAPFSKSAQEAAESAPGVGLGLALCRRLARELGGRLEIAAKNGEAAGATVCLRLPIGG